MSNKYKRLASEERYAIGIMLAEGRTKREIARALNREPSTIIRELKRGIVDDSGRYQSEASHTNTILKRSETRKRPRLKEATIRAYVGVKLREGWSPELIAGRLWQEHSDLSISHEAIYQWIYTEAPEHISDLTRQHKRRWRHGTRNPFKTGGIAHRVSIDERPSEVDLRQVTGHWEADTVVSRRTRSAALQVLVERKSRYTMMTSLPGLDSHSMRDALIRRLRKVPSKLRQTITYDNGTENAAHVMVNRELGTSSYFCHAYHSWERGTVENTIGLIRRFFPKQTDFEKISPYRIKKVEQWLNHRPRKCLNFQTPIEVFAASVALTR